MNVVDTVCAFDDSPASGALSDAAGQASSRQ
jgi:hypothetical protein